MTSHFVLLSVFAFLVSLVFAVLMRDEPSTQLRTGALMFGGFKYRRRKQDIPESTPGTSTGATGIRSDDYGDIEV